MRVAATYGFIASSCLFVFAAPRRSRNRFRVYVIHGLLFIFIGFNADSLGFAREIDVSSERFLNEAPQKEAEYLLIARRLQGSVSLTFTLFDPTGKIKNRMRSQKKIKQNEQCASFLYQSFDGEKTDVDSKRSAGGVYAINPGYAFELKRANSKSDWFLEHLDLHGNGASFNEGEPIREMPLSWMDFMYDVYGRRISALIHEKPFRVTRASVQNRNGRGLFQIDFICPHPIQKDTEPYFVQGGSLLLDPDQYWCIQEYDLKTQSIDGTGTKRARLEFKAHANSYPIVTRMVRTGKSPLGNVSEEIFEFNLHEVSKLPPDEEFTLTAYGLPEPMGAPPLPQSRTWLWLMVAAVAAAALAILFAWLKRRALTSKVQISMPSTRSRP